MASKTSGNIRDRKAQLESFTYEPGEQLGLFKVYDKTDDEVVIGEDDRHPDFRVSLFIHRQNGISKKLTISTTIKFNSLFGRLCFLIVGPFHKLIVPAILKGILKATEAGNTR